MDEQPTGGSEVVRGTRLPPEATGIGAVDPAAVLRPGRGDAVALLVVWLLRRSFLPLLIIGAVVAAAIAGGDQPEPDLDTPADVLGLLLSPWVGVALAVITRVVANLLALLLAVPLSARSRPSAYEGTAVTRWSRAVFDRMHATRAYRELRWTSPVRDLATARLGRVGDRLRTTGLVLTIATVALAAPLAAALVFALTR